MSGLGRKRVSKWDSEEDTHNHHSSINTKSGSYYRDKNPEAARFNAESSSSRRPAAMNDQYHGEARTRSRVSLTNHNSYYSEQDETRPQFFHRSGSRSNSRSRSRSRSPVYRARRDAESFDRHKSRTRVSPLPSRECSKRGGDHQFVHQGDQCSNYGWEDKVKKPRETKYQSDEQAMVKGVRSSDYNTDLPEDKSRREHVRDGVLDPSLRRNRSELTEEKESKRREGDSEGEFNRSSNIPCKFFAAGFCRNGKYCRFSHHVADRKQQPQDNSFYRHDNNNHSGNNNKWNDVERLDNGKVSEIEVSRVRKGVSEPKGNGSSWIDDMEMSPDWNYGAQNLKNPLKEEPGVGIIGQSSHSGVVKENLATNYDPIAPVQAFNQNTQNHNVLPYQSSLTSGGSQQVAPADFPVVSNLSNPESGKVYQNNHHSMVDKAVPGQNIVNREQIDQISNISASIAQFLANGQPIPQLTQGFQIPLHSESPMAEATTKINSMSSNPNQLWALGESTQAEGVPAVTASKVSNVDRIQELAVYPNASEENVYKKTDETSIEEEGKRNGEDTNDAENAVDEDDDDDGSDDENKKGKDPKGMRAFKFALVEIVKELLKPAWKEGKMNKDGYKNIVKKVVEKVTGTMQNGNVPQTQEKIDHYLSASKPKLIKLVQAYISKVKKT